jgi:YegS/Rv2252/BmrU family lipid kinase
MPRYQIIVNPISGRGTGGQSIPQIESLLNEHGLDFELVQTERPWHAAELARQAAEAGFDVVVAGGGDGTVNEVINGLMQAKAAGLAIPAMGVLTVGRGNDFGFSMNIPATRVQACQVLAADQRRKIDIGLVKGGLYPEGRYFGNGVGIGFDAVVGFEALKMKRLHGFISYLAAALKTIYLYFQAPQVTIQLEDAVIELPALMVSVMNGRRMGGGFMMAPESIPDDGKLDLCLVRQVSRPQMFALIARFLQGTQYDHPAVQGRRVSQLTVSTQQGVLPAHSDGETLCTDGQQLVIKLLAQQIELVTEIE